MHVDARSWYTSCYRRDMQSTRVFISDLGNEHSNTTPLAYVKKVMQLPLHISEDRSKQILRRHKDVSECRFSDPRHYSVQCRACKEYINTTMKNTCRLSRFLPHTVACKKLQYVLYHTMT
jgi:hypothetical protein